jgi:hypothetical protein
MPPVGVYLFRLQVRPPSTLLALHQKLLMMRILHGVVVAERNYCQGSRDASVGEAGAGYPAHMIFSPARTWAVGIQKDLMGSPRLG